MKIKPAEIPNKVSGLRKNGKRDKRYKRGTTMIEIEEYMEQASGSRKCLRF